MTKPKSYLSRDIRHLNLFHLFAALLFVSLLLGSDLARPVRAEYSGMELIVDLPRDRTQIVFAPGEKDRVFALAQAGEINIVDLTTNTILPTPFLTIPNVDNEVEGGAVSMAFHPDYQNNGKFYVNVTIDNGGIPIEVGVPEGEEVLSPFSSHIFEYTVSAADPSVANPTPSKILEVVQPQNSHNGGWMGFGPNDGYLYVMSGDGGAIALGAGSTPGIGNSQDLTDNLLGKILRLDVDGPDAYPADPDRNYAIPSTNPFVGSEGDDEIWAYGLRNAFRGSFDRATADLFFGDVGAASREEVDFQAADSTGGENYGWRVFEGTEPFPPASEDPIPTDVTDPIYDYLHLGQGQSGFEGNTVIGGYVYRGSDPDLQGKYIFADFISDEFWTFDPADPSGTIENITGLFPSQKRTVSFAEDADGNLYTVDYRGKIHRLLTDSVTPGDFDANGQINIDDLSLWQAGFSTSQGATFSDGDSDEDGDVDGSDFLAYQRNFGYDVLQLASSPSRALAVPEPSSVALLALCCLAPFRARRLIN